MPKLRSSADVFVKHPPAKGKSLIARDLISLVVADPSAEPGPVPHPVCKVFWTVGR